MDKVHILFNNDAPHQGYESLDAAEADAKALQNKAKSDMVAERISGIIPRDYWHVHTVPFTPLPQRRAGQKPLTVQDLRRPEVICMCGSSRFIEQMAILAWEFEKEGKVVLSLHLLPASYPGVAPDHQAEAEGIAEKMDELHLRKIDMADRVFIVNVDGYIGDSTRREIAYATKHGKPIVYLQSPS